MRMGEGNKSAIICNSDLDVFIWLWTKYRRLPMTGRIKYGGTRKFDSAKAIKYHWENFSVCFDCPCGEKEIILCESGDTKKCACGIIYKLNADIVCVARTMIEFRCDICGQLRPCELISEINYVISYDFSEKHKKHDLPVGTMKRNVKYCNDNKRCLEGAQIMEEYKLMGWSEYKGGS